MSNEENLKVYGCLEKKETLVNIDERIVPGTLVFESVQPFPGYYHEVPYQTKPLYLYLALKEDYCIIDIERARENIMDKYGILFYAAKGFITIYDTKYPVIRVRHLSGYDQMEKIEKALAEEGIVLYKGTRKHDMYPALIKLYKFFDLRKEDEGIYVDTSEDFHAYIEIPKSLKWSEFEEVTQKVKYNWDLHAFDAAICSFFVDGKVREFVRIYSEKQTLHYLNEVRKLYIKKIK